MPDRRLGEHDATERVASGELEQVTLARRRLNTGAHRLAGDLERLLGDLHRPTHHAWRWSAS